MRLLHSTPEDIKQMIEAFDNDIRAIRKNAAQMSWYMRGGVSYEDVLNMSSTERTILKEIIDDNLETTKESKLPFF